MRPVWVFFALACAITWLCALPAVLAWVGGEEPPAYAVPLVALSAFGPTIAAVLVASRQGEVRSVFRPWRTRPIWILVALFTPMAVQLVAKLLEVLLGGHPSSWVQLPSAPEHVAALVIFSIGEEFGWRGFAQPRLERHYNPVVAALIVGTAWSVWHLMYIFTPGTGELDVLGLLVLVMLPLWAIIFAWLAHRAEGSLFIALALHAGGHLDSVARIPQDEVRVRFLTLLVLAVVAFLAARSLLRKR